MLSNKTLQHIIMTDCQINREIAEFLVSLFMLRPNMILLHTDHNPVIFDSVMIFNIDWYMKIYTKFNTKISSCI